MGTLVGGNSVINNYGRIKDNKKGINKDGGFSNQVALLIMLTLYPLGIFFSAIVTTLLWPVVEDSFVSPGVKESLYSDHKEGRSERDTCSPTQLSNMTGYFVSQDGFYGYPHRIEYLNVKLDAGFLVATKLVGDRNVPRGKVSWTTLSSYKCVSDQSKLPIKIQVRMNINDPNAFIWIEKGNYVRVEDRNTLVVFFSCGLDCLAEGRLLRVQKEQAVDAENKMNDHE